MFENFAAWLLETYVGKYINVSPDKLSIGFLSGAIELEHVSLKLEAFNNNDLPIQVKFGYIDKIKLNISLATLRYSPLRLVIENLCIILGPKQKQAQHSKQTNDETSNSNEIKETHEQNHFETSIEQNDIEKRKKLDEEEKKWIDELKTSNENESNKQQTIEQAKHTSSIYSFVSSFCYGLLKNLHAHVRKMNVRYEDESNNICFGFNFSSLLVKNDLNSAKEFKHFNESTKPATSATTTTTSTTSSNESSTSTTNPNATSPPELTDFTFKLCDLKDLVVYSDRNLLFNNNLTDVELFDLISKVGNEKNLLHNVEYLLKPFSIRANICQDVSSKPIRNKQRPRLHILVSMDEFNLNVKQTHLDVISSILNSFSSNSDAVFVESDLTSRSAPLAITYYEPFNNQIENSKSKWKRAFDRIKQKNKKLPIEMKDFIKWSCDVNIYAKLYESSLSTRLEENFSQNQIAKTNETTNKPVESVLANQPNEQVQENAETHAEIPDDYKQTSESAEKLRVESEWSTERLLVLRRAIFEKKFLLPRCTPNDESSKSLELDEKMKETIVTMTPTSRVENNSKAFNVYNYLSLNFNSLLSFYSKGQANKTKELEITAQANDATIDNEVIDFLNDSIENESLFRRDSLFAVFELNIQTLNLTFYSLVDKQIGCFNLNDSQFKFEIMPRYDSYSLEVHSKSLSLMKRIDEHNAFSLIKSNMTSQSDTLESSKASKALKIRIEYNNSSSRTSKSKLFLDMSLVEWTFFYNSDIYNELIEYFRACSNFLQRLKKRSAKDETLDSSPQAKLTRNSLVNTNDESEVEKNIRKLIRILNFSFESKSCKIVLVKDISQIDSNVLIVDLANLLFKKVHLLGENRLFPTNIPNCQVTTRPTRSTSTINNQTDNSRTMSGQNSRQISNANQLLLMNSKIMDEMKSYGEQVDGHLNNAIQNDEDDDDDEDDVYETPIGTPPRESYFGEKQNLQEEVLNDLDLFNSTFYDLFLFKIDQVQIVCGKMNENWQFCLNKTHSSKHLLEKCNVQMRLQFLKFNEEEISKSHNFKTGESKSQWPCVKLKADSDSIRFHLNDLNTECLFDVLENLKSKEKKKRSTNRFDDRIGLDENELNSKYDEKIKSKKTISIVTDVNLKQLNVTMSTSNNLLNEHTKDNWNSLKSLCELKAESIQSSVNVEENGDIQVNLSILNILLIDAEQTYGQDFQLLAFAHKNIYLDSEKGNILNVNEQNSSNYRLNEEKLSSPSNNNFNFSLSMSQDELVMGSALSRLDIVLNPETISDLTLLLHKFTRHFSNFRKNRNEAKRLLNKGVESKEEVKRRTQTTFTLNELKVLAFIADDVCESVEGLQTARKIAILSVDELFVERNHSNDVACRNLFVNVKNFKLNELKAVDENKKKCERDYKSNVLLQMINKNESDSTLLSDLNKNSTSLEQCAIELLFNQNLENGESELLIELNSMKYFHSSEFINNIEQCMKSFSNLPSTLRKQSDDSLRMRSSESFDETNQSLVFENDQEEGGKFKLKLFFIEPIVVLRTNPMVSNYLLLRMNYMEVNSSKMTDLDDDLHDASFNVNNALLLDRQKFTFSAKELEALFVHKKMRENSFDLQFNEDSKSVKSLDNAHLSFDFDALEDSVAYEKKVLMEKTSFVGDFEHESVAKQLTIRLYAETICRLNLSKVYLDDLGRTVDNLLIKDELKTQNQDTQKKRSSEELIKVNVSTEIRRVDVVLLADAEQNNQEIAELTLNKFALDVLREEQMTTLLDISLDSVEMLDKLVGSNLSSSFVNEQVLLSTSDPRSSLHSSSFKLSKFISSSLPNINKRLTQGFFKYANYIKPSKHQQREDGLKNIYKLTKLYLNMDKSNSVSLPSEVFERCFHEKQQQTSSKSANKCPLTPPPSRTNSRSCLKKSKSYNNFDLPEQQRRENAYLKKSRDSLTDATLGEDNFSTECNMKSPIRITAKLVDTKHANFKRKHKLTSKNLDIKFSYLKLNLNSETWILILDLFGFGSKIYPSGDSKSEFVLKLRETLRSDNFKRLPRNKVKFQVDNFDIQLFENKLETKLAKFSVRNCSATIQSTSAFLKVNGKLDTLNMFDLSDTKGLYNERFRTNGREPIRFELFKYNGPMDVLSDLFSFDIGFKLRMKRIRYVHTHRYIVTLVNCLQQFNQMQDALGRMRALSEGLKNVSFSAQRSSRIKLDIDINSAIVIIPVCAAFDQALVLNAKRVRIENKFLISNEKGSLAYKNLGKSTSSDTNSHTKENHHHHIELQRSCSGLEVRECLLDAMNIQIQGVNLFTATFHLKDECPYASKSIIDFGEYVFVKTREVLIAKRNMSLKLERNLEGELSHKSPDWFMHFKLKQFQFQLDEEQYKIVRGLLDQNIGEQIKPAQVPNFLIMNPKIETVLSGRIWKAVHIHLDLRNVSISLITRHIHSQFANLKFNMSSLIFESYSDGSKVIDLVSSDLLLQDTRTSLNNQDQNKFTDIITKKSSSNLAKTNRLATNGNTKKLQLEIHNQSTKNSSRYSILFNNCRIITYLDWFNDLKEFLCAEFPNPNNQGLKNPFKLKLNVSNSDFVMLSDKNKSCSHAMILRLSAFLEYNQQKLHQPFQSWLQSIEMFSCQMDAIEETALPILEPTMLNIHLKPHQTHFTNSPFDQIHSDFSLDIVIDLLRVRVSYLDYKLFLKIVEAIQSQMKNLALTNRKSNQQVSNLPNDTAVHSNSSQIRVRDAHVNINTFCLFIIDDCEDIDIPLFDFKFNRFKMIYHLNNNDSQVSNSNHNNSNNGQGSIESGVCVDYYNRLLSGWEPLVEPWLGRFNWKFKQNPQSTYFTITSMDVLNVNISNPFIDLITTVASNWTNDFNKKTFQFKLNKIFQPYKLVNLTGQPVKFCLFQTANMSLESNEPKSTSEQQFNDLSECSEWLTLDENCEKSFNFYENSHHDKGNNQLNSFNNKSSYNLSDAKTNSFLGKLLQNRIRMKLDDWSEIRSLTIDKVGTYFRTIERVKSPERDESTKTPKTSLSNFTCLIFDISLSGYATKLIKIKSPVCVRNRLNHKIECRIESKLITERRFLEPLLVEIEAGNEICVPIKYLPCNIWFRPVDLSNYLQSTTSHECEFSTKSINLNDITKPGQIEYFQLSCRFRSELTSTPITKKNVQLPLNQQQQRKEEKFFHFFAKIKRHNYPKKIVSNNKNGLIEYNFSNQVAGHLISIEPSFTFLNLLPIELELKFEKSQEYSNNGMKNRGKNEAYETYGKLDSYNLKHFHEIDVSKDINMIVDMDNYQLVKPIQIRPSQHLANLANIYNSDSNNQIITETNGSDEDKEKLEKHKNHAYKSSETSKTSNAANMSSKRLIILKKINFVDEKRRPLFLLARIIFKMGSVLNTNMDSQSATNDIDDAYFSPCPIEVQLSSIYCFFNLTGIPLVFRQYNCEEAAGQSEDHEKASSNQPLLFSFNDFDSPYACSMRVGKFCNDFKAHLDLNSMPFVDKNDLFVSKWCKPFGLDSGSSYRALKVINNSLSYFHQSSSNKKQEHSLCPDLVYYIGIEIKPGKGLLKDTTFVFFSTRYYLVNQSEHDLLISQSYFIETHRKSSITELTWNTNKNYQLSDRDSSGSESMRSESSSQHGEKEIAKNIVLLKDSIIQFHWPRADFDQLLSVRLKDDPKYNWSGGFKIDQINSFYLNLRNIQNYDQVFYVKVEIFLRNGTFYVIFSNKYDLPFPIKVINESEISVYISQADTLDERYNINIKPNQSVDYSWDEMINEKKLIIGVRGGTSDSISMNSKDTSKYLYYENFFYIAFMKNDANLDTAQLKYSNEIGSHELVLTVCNKQICLDRKEPGNRAQLWYLTDEGLLVHEGSSSPKEVGQNMDLSNRYVLDIDEMAPRPNHFSSLTLKLPDNRRKNTQKWYVSANNELCCQTPNMCVQSLEFRPKSKLFLGPIVSKNENTIRKISLQRLRPGSGHLIVKVRTDGPTRVLKISNIITKPYLSITWQKEDNETNTSSDATRSDGLNKYKMFSKFEFYVNLTGGIGLSIVQWLNQQYEELAYVNFKSFVVNYEHNQHIQKCTLSIQSIQVCNQLLQSQKQNMLIVQPAQQANSSGVHLLPPHEPTSINQFNRKCALQIEFLRRFKNEQIFTIENMTIDIDDVIFQIEEKLLWKTIQFLNNFSSKTLQEHESLDIKLSEYEFKYDQQLKSHESLVYLNRVDYLSNNYYKSQINSLITDSQARKYSFNKFQINIFNMTLSVYKTSKLTSDLLNIKSKLGIPLIQFENAKVEFKPFTLINEFDTTANLFEMMKKHYTQELRANAIRILGSVDFLGNPLGLMVDFKESLSNVLSNGDVTDFVFSITHGVANSVSKFSGSLSNELSELTMDERHTETREQIRNFYNNGSIDHFVGGALGFAVGVVGGALSIATQTYRGFNENGMTGAFTGLGKGAVGTVSKPLVGVLDFATGIASAIRETSKTNYKMETPRVREIRCCSTHGALLAPFSRPDSNGQKILYQVNNFDLTEKFIALESYDYQSESLICLVTNLRVLLIKSSEHEMRIIFAINYDEIRSTSVYQENESNQVYLELCLHDFMLPSTSSLSNNQAKRKYPSFKLENKERALTLEKKINYAKADYDETVYALPNDVDD